MSFMAHKDKQSWLSKRREHLRLSQEELVSRLQLQGLDISRATFSHWETGRYSIPLDSPEFRRALAHVLQMTVREMMVAAGYEIEDAANSEAARRAAYIVDQLAPAQRELALRLLEQFLEKT